MDTLKWQDDGLCREVDPELFFPDTYPTTEAKKVCALCPVIDDCLAFALETDEPYGVWGGRSPRQRRIMLNRAA